MTGHGGAVRRARLALVLAALLMLGLVAGGLVAPAQAHGGKGGKGGTRVVVNKVTAQVHRDDKSVVRSRWRDAKTATRGVTAVNIARARASCTDCSATAIAFEVVLASRARDVVADNMALALNEDCTGCEAFAGAYQFVVAAAGDVRLTRQGRAELRRIERAAERLRHKRLPGPELVTRADALAARVLDVLSRELVVTPAKKKPGKPNHPGRPGMLAHVVPMLVGLAAADGEPTVQATTPESATSTTPEGAVVSMYRDVDTAPAG